METMIVKVNGVCRFAGVFVVIKQIYFYAELIGFFVVVLYTILTKNTASMQRGEIERSLSLVWIEKL